ncbi:MAG: endonuclease/exonuclease/phosphatase family protein [Paludibacteraceae bacterium]
MKKILLCFLFVSLTIDVFAQDTLRIMTYNVASGLMGNMQQIADYIRNKDADIVALQEVDLRTNRPETPTQHGKNQMTELGYFSDLLPIFGSINNYPTGGYYGLGLLSKYPILNISNVQLPQVVDKKEPRTMIVGTWDINGKLLTVACTHLSLDSRNREVQMKYIRKYMRKYKGYKIICGDLNSTYSEGLVAKVFSNWKDALPTMQLTFHSNNPYAKYDWMLLENKSNIKILNTIVDKQCKLSDHLPCYIDIVIP